MQNKIGFCHNRGYVMKCARKTLLLSIFLCAPCILESASYFTSLFSKESSDAVLGRLEEVVNSGQLQDLMLRHDFRLDPALIKRLAKAGYNNLTQPLTNATINDLIIYLRHAISPAASAVDRKNIALLTDAASNLVQKYKHYFTLDKQIQAGAQGLAKLIAFFKQRGALQQNLQRLGTSVTGLAQEQALGNLSTGIAQVAKANAAIKVLGLTPQLLQASIPQEIMQVAPSYWQQYGKPALGITTSALTGLGSLATSGIGYLGTQTGLSNYVSPQVINLINHYPQLRNLVLGLALVGVGTLGGYQYYVSNKPKIFQVLAQKEGESTTSYIERLKNVRDKAAAAGVANKARGDIVELQKNVIDFANAKINELELQQLPWYRRWFWRPSLGSSSISTQVQQPKASSVGQQAQQPPQQKQKSTGTTVIQPGTMPITPTKSSLSTSSKSSSASSAQASHTSQPFIQVVGQQQTQLHKQAVAQQSWLKGSGVLPGQVSSSSSQAQLPQSTQKKSQKGAGITELSE